MIRSARPLAAATLAAVLLLQLLLGAARAACRRDAAAPSATAAAQLRHDAHDAGRAHREPADDACRRDARSCEAPSHDAACALASACAPAAIAERALLTPSNDRPHARPERAAARLTSRALTPDDPPPRLPA